MTGVSTDTPVIFMFSLSLSEQTAHQHKVVRRFAIPAPQHGQVEVVLQTALHIAAQRLDGVAQQLRSASGMSLNLFARLALVAGARQQHLAPRCFPLPPLKLLPVQTLFLLQCRHRLIQRLLRHIRL